MPEKVTSLIADPPLKVRFGNFEIVSDAQGRPLSLGKGTFGRTYQARHTYLETIVALKIITERYVSDPTVRQRFLIEARAVAKLSHPHIARLYDFGEADGVLHYAMEYCGGGSLADYVAKKGPVPLRHVFEIAQHITGALKCAHEAGFIHRDLKPSNIMLASPEGPLFAKLIDFGLVQPSLPGATRSMTESESADGARFLGTPLFASPEQLREEPMDVRTDLFSLGITLWYLIVGGPPESGASAAIAASRLSPESYASRIPASVPPAFRDVLARLLEKDRNKRFRTAAELSVALIQCAAALGFRIAKEDGEATVNLNDLEAPGDGFSPPTAEEVAPMELERVDDPLDSTFKIIARLNEDFSGLNYVAEEQQKGGAMRFLHVLHPMLLEDDEILGVLRKHLAQLASLEDSEVLRPERLVAFTDYTCVVVEKSGTSDLMSILRTERTVQLVEAAPLLESIADVCDRITAAGLPGLQLAPNRIFVEWPEAENRGAKNAKHSLGTARPRLFPRFLAVSEAPELARLNEPEDVTSTMTTDMLSDPARADNMPEHFAMLLYRIVAGRNCPIAASLSSQAYVAIPGLSEHSNRTLSLVIAKQSSIALCGQVLRDVLGAEGLVPRIPGHPTAGFTARSSSTTVSPLEKDATAGSAISTKTGTGTSRMWKAPSISTDSPREMATPPAKVPTVFPIRPAAPPLAAQPKSEPVPEPSAKIDIGAEKARSPEAPLVALKSPVAPPPPIAPPPPPLTKPVEPKAAPVIPDLVRPSETKEEKKRDLPPAKIDIADEKAKRPEPPAVALNSPVAPPPPPPVAAPPPVTKPVESKAAPVIPDLVRPSETKEEKKQDLSPAKIDITHERAKRPEPPAITLSSPVAAPPPPLTKSVEPKAAPVIPDSRRPSETKEEKKRDLPPAKAIEKEKVEVAKAISELPQKKTPTPMPAAAVTSPEAKPKKPDPVATALDGLSSKPSAPPKFEPPVVPKPATARPSPALSVSAREDGVPASRFEPETASKDWLVRAGVPAAIALLVIAASYAGIRGLSHRRTTAVNAVPPAQKAATPPPAAVSVPSPAPAPAAQHTKPAGPIAGRFAARLRTNGAADAPETEREISIDPSAMTGYVIEYASDPGRKVQIVDAHVTAAGGFEGRVAFASATAGAHPDEQMKAVPQPDGQVQITFRGQDQALGDYTLAGVAHPWTSADEENLGKLLANGGPPQPPTNGPSHESESAAEAGPNEANNTATKAQSLLGRQTPDAGDAVKTHTTAAASHRKTSVSGTGDGTTKTPAVSHQSVTRAAPPPRPVVKTVAKPASHDGNRPPSFGSAPGN